MKILNVGFVSTRFAGIDGVSLEASKWAETLEQAGHKCFWFAGQIDRDDEFSHLVPEAHFKHDLNEWIVHRTFGENKRHPSVSKAIHELRSRLKRELHRFIERNSIDLIIAENALTIPMHVPLGLALTETLAETQIPAIAHHHDFFWERGRFSVNAVKDYIQMAFPPNLPNIAHVTINTPAREQLALRTGISSTIIPNVLDFDNPPQVDKASAANFKKSIGLKPEDLIFLQPTRVVKRKGIEHSIELIKELNDSRCRLVISHEAGDEGFEYGEWLMEKARKQGVDLHFISAKITDPLFTGNLDSSDIKYSLWDIYPHADLVTFPSLYEGFGNAFLEAVYFKKPLLINRYETFIKDIEPLGFDFAVMDSFLSHQTALQVKKILDSSAYREAMVNLNYEIAAHYFSFSVLRDQINSILKQLFGPSVKPLVNEDFQPQFRSMDINSKGIWQDSFFDLDHQSRLNIIKKSADFVQSAIEYCEPVERKLPN